MNHRFQTLLLMCAAVAACLGASGCVILPAEGRTLVSDVHRTRLDVERLHQLLMDSHERLAQWQDSFRQAEGLHFTQTRDRLVEMELRLTEIESRLARVQSALSEQTRQTSEQSPRATVVTTGGIVLSGAEAMRSADEMLVKGRFTEAESRYRDVLARFPRADFAEQAQFGLAESLESQDRASDAIEAYLALPDRYPGGSLAPQARFRAALCARRLGDNDQALKLLEEVVHKHPTYEGLARVQAVIQELQAAGAGVRP
jgi:TolA-binding protein